MTALEALIKARAEIAEPARWTQKAYRRDATGEMCTQADAVCWCAAGAVRQVSGGYNFASKPALKVLVSVVGGQVERWNDAPERKHAEVLAAFDTAIAKAQR
jgi:hypothetical protein